MPKLDLSSFEKMLQQGKSFELTEEQYEENVKKRMPQTDYLKRNSPVAKKAKEYGYRIHVEERIHRVLIVTKTENKK